MAFTTMDEARAWQPGFAQMASKIQFDEEEITGLLDGPGSFDDNWNN